MSPQDKPDDGLRYNTSDKFFTQKSKDNRYDTLIGVILAFAMAIGVWLYAIKPWQTTSLNPATETTNVPTLAVAPPAQIVEPQIAQIPPIKPPLQTTQTPQPTIVTTALTKPSTAIVATPKIEKPAIIAPTSQIAAIVTPPPAPIVAPAAVITPPPLEKPVVPPVAVAPVVEAPPPPPVVEPVAVATPPTPEALPANVVMRESIEFTMGNARVPEYAKARLREVAAQLKNDTRQLKIIGHTDGIGYTGANRRLSLRRANSVKAFLVAEGVNAEHLSTEGVGESQPIADNQTIEGRNRNRRIEIIE